MAEPPLEEHPLSLELQSLRASVGRFQDEAHTSAVKLQRHSLDAVRAHERAVNLERENDVLKSELAVLRAHPQLYGQLSPTDNQSQVQELTLSLRRLSHKLSLTEEALLVANTSLASSQAQAAKASANADNAYELGARVRGREEEALVKQKDLEWRIKKLEEELKMSDGVVQEYASLVRGMDGRSSSGSETFTLQDSLKEGKMGLDRLLRELQQECDALERKLSANITELEVCKSQLEAERQTNEIVEKELGATRTELEKLKLEDGTAAKMVSRYMQFSQTSTNNLLTTLNNLQSRHSSTLATLHSQNHALSTQLRSLESQNERLRSTLDELGGEITKEAFGRRREIVQRIRMGGREDRVVEGLRRWVRRGEEILGRLRGDEDQQDTMLHHIDPYLDMVQHARILIEGLDNGVLDEESALSLSGARARDILVRLGLDGLLEELGRETERRIYLEKAVAEGGFHEIIRELETDRMEDDAPPQVPEKTPRLQNAKHLSSLPMPTNLPERIGSLPPALPVVPINKILLQDIDLHPNTESGDKEDIARCNTSPNPSSPPIKIGEGLTDVVDEATGSRVEVVIPASQDSEKAVHAQNIPNAADDIQISIEAVMPQHENAAVDNCESHFEKDIILTSSPTPSTADLLASSSVSTAEAYEVDSFSFPITTTLDSPSEVASVVPQPHPMVAELARINKRYDDLQRAFRDCHLALEGLKASLGAEPSSTSNGHSTSFIENSSSSSLTSTQTSITSHILPPNILRAALGRLDDYTEDARVELEIRIGDETLLAKGYEALLSVPGALASVNGGERLPVEKKAQVIDEDHMPTQSEVEKQIEAFVSGTDPAVHKAKETFARKLEDVQHDIAALKRAIHDPESLVALDVFGEASSSTSSLVSPHHSEHTNGNGHGWTSWIRGSPSRPSSPAPPAPSLGPSPTFGSIMTSPRLRHSSSNSSFQGQGSRSRKGSFFGFGLGGATEQLKDPLSVLNLKVPMPNFGATPATSTVPGSAQAGMFGGGYGLMSPTSPVGSTSRPRTVSTNMYMLGLGASGASSPAKVSPMSRSASVGLNQKKPTFPMASTRQNPLQHNSRGPVDEEGSEATDNETEDEDDTDVE